LRDENRELREQLGQRYKFDNMVGHSPEMQEVFATITARRPHPRHRSAVRGERRGKDLIARAIHHHSPRANHPFVKINCTALPENLMESELFGYEKGAFTGANTSKPGKFEQADTGTVFLDEIGDVPATIQVKLLRILQEREFERLVGNKTKHNRRSSLGGHQCGFARRARAGTFREDLYYRLNVLPINIPHYAIAREEQSLSSSYFVKKLSKDLNSSVESISDAAVQKLLEYHWPVKCANSKMCWNEAWSWPSGPILEVGDIKTDTTESSHPP